MKLFLLGSEVDNKPLKSLKKSPTDQMKSTVLKEVAFACMTEKTFIYLISFSLTEMEAL